MWSCRVPRPRFASRNVAKNSRLRRDARAIANRYVAGDPRLAGDHTSVSDVRRTRNSNLRHDEAGAADADVVPDLNQVVDLRARANQSIVDAAAIDRRIGANLHVVTNDASADMRNSEVGAAGEDIAEPVCGNPCTCMDHYPLTQYRAGLQRCSRQQPGSGTDPHTITHDTMSADEDVVADAGRFTDNRVRVEGDTAPQNRPASDACRRMNCRAGFARRVKHREQHEQRLSRFLDDDHRRYAIGGVGKSSGNEYDPGAGSRECGCVPGVCKKTELGRLGSVERSDTIDDRAGGTLQFPAHHGRNGLSGERACTLTAEMGRTRRRRRHRDGGRDTPAGWGVRELAAVGFGAAFTLAMTFAVRSSCLSAARITPLCEATSNMIA